MELGQSQWEKWVGKLSVYLNLEDGSSMFL
jgi:hypothetical protein